MQTLLINTFLIIFIITVIWDLSGFLNDITKIIYEKITKKKWMGQQLPKIISCSYCVKFHASWVYLILFNSVNIITGFAIASAFTFIGILLKNILTKLKNKIETF